MSTSWEDLFDRATAYEVDLEAVRSGYVEAHADEREDDSDEEEHA